MPELWGLIRDNLEDIFLSDKVLTEKACTYMDMFMFEERKPCKNVVGAPAGETVRGSLAFRRRKGNNRIASF